MPKHPQYDSRKVLRELDIQGVSLFVKDKANQLF